MSKENNSKGELKNLWEEDPYNKYQWHVTIPSTFDERAVHVDDLEKRKEAYGICGECNEPGTGWKWCQSCNAKRLRENFKNWTSGNKDIDEFIQQSQLNAVCHTKYLEWMPFESFQNVTYITRGGFGKIYSADWPEGFIDCWDIENQKWVRVGQNRKVALKSLDNSTDINTEFLNEIKTHLQIHLLDVIRCYGITQNPNTEDYIMVLPYCKGGNLRDYEYKGELNHSIKIDKLYRVARGLSEIHSAEKVHQDFHSGNILLDGYTVYISDLGMCKPANNEGQSQGIYGVLPYVAPEVLYKHQYTKASDIYSFGIIMNEFISGEVPYNNIPHDYVLAMKICKGLRPKISEDTPKLLEDLIIKCWDAEAENRPTAKELYEVLLSYQKDVPIMGEINERSEIYSQIKKCEKIKEEKLKNRSSKPKNIKTHPQAIYTSRLLNFKNLVEPVNSSDLSSFHINSSATSTSNLISECLDLQFEWDDDNDNDGKNSSI